MSLFFSFSKRLQLLAVLIFTAISCDGTNLRRGKVFSFFSVVQFPNEVCTSTTPGRNGICFTADECEQRGGMSSGQCAEGFGVCCIIRLRCGGTSTTNITHLVLEPTLTPPTSSCDYTICPSVSNICRMKLEFTTFEIAQPFKLDVRDVGATQVSYGGAIGDCRSDSFSVSTKGSVGTPTICGFNTNQHVYVDVGDDCITASFSFGELTIPNGVQRQYDIQVLQFICGSEMAGPPGCLQFFTAATGSIASFNFPTNAKTLTGTGVAENNPTHLSNQNYNICFRRAIGQCAICFQPSLRTGAPQSFGLSVYMAFDTIAAQSTTETSCSSDYILIPEATSNVIQAVNQNTVIAGVQRFCGRFLNTAAGMSVSQEVCTGTTPFQVSFVTDENELVEGITLSGILVNNQNELHKEPGGIVGFQLDYRQVAC